MKNNKKKVWISSVIIITAVLFGIFPSLSFAHSPSEVTLSYNKDTKVLEVKVTHSVSFPNSHYVKKVEVIKNGEVGNALEYQSQPDKKTFVYTYELELTSGDQLEVKASCNIFGSKTVQLKVE